ncbi:MAG: glycosyltransferase [Myxococcota bacterium]
MRIVHVITDLRLGGAETALVGLAHASARRGHRVEVVALKQLGLAAAPLLSSGIPCNALGAPETPGVGLVSTVSVLSAHLRKRSADVIHAWLASGCAAVHLATSPEQPRVYGIQVTDTPPPAVCALLASGSGPHVQWVAASRAAAASWSRAVPGSAATMRVIPNTVEVEAPPVPEPPGARPLFLGRFAHQKGLDVLLRALVDTDLVVDIRGAGPEEARLRAMARELGVEQRANMPGPTANPLTALSNASFLVLPSRSEGMPLVVMEAMASARPVVATAVGGTDEVVLHEETGLLVPPEDPDALRNAMLRLSHDAKLRERLGRAGRERWARHFRHDVVVERFLQAYADARAG